jgi:RHS repeat-associated protein
VLFDNLQVTHVRGSLLEESHYYPFGLIMSAVSSKALTFGGPENKYRYNGKEEQRREFSDGTGLEWLDYGARMFDNQTGRFFSQDRFTEKYYPLSPFQYVANNPISNIDVNGDSIWVSIGGQDYYYGKNGDKDYAFFSGKDGAQYKGTDDFAKVLSGALKELMGVKDEEIQARLGVMLTSKFKVLMHDGRTEGDGGNNADTYIMKDGSTKKTDAISGSDPSVAGIRVSWDPSNRQTANGVANANGADPILSLSHELIGHGFQGTVRQITPRSINGSIRTQEGYLRATEADAQTMWNKVADATGRTNMKVTGYTALRKFDAQGNVPTDSQGRPANVSRVTYTLPNPGFQINWNKKRKY